MPITQLTIQNFKGISDKVEIPLRPVTLLFGANSAGKSTIFQALLYLRELLERQNVDADRVLVGGDAIDLGGFRQFVHNHDLSRSVRIGVTFKLDDDGLPDYRTHGERPEESASVGSLLDATKSDADPDVVAACSSGDAVRARRVAASAGGERVRPEAPGEARCVVLSRKW